MCLYKTHAVVWQASGTMCDCLITLLDCYGIRSLYKTWEALRKQRRVWEIEKDNNAPSEAK